MKLRDVKIVEETNPDDSGVETYPIDVVDPITELKLCFGATNGATGPNQNNPINGLIKEFAVVDGSEVITSLNGKELTALYAFDRGELPYSWGQQHGGMEQFAQIPLYFGRSSIDPEYILNPGRFRNPAIRLEWDLANVSPVGANGYGSGTASFFIYAKVMEEGATPRGYLMSKMTEEYTSAASGVHTTYLPTDYDIRKLVVRPYAQYVGMDDVITNLKLSIDQDKEVPFDIDSEEFILLMHNWFPEYQFDSWNEGSVSDQIEHWMGERVFGQATGDTNAKIFAVDGWTDGYYTIQTSEDNTGVDIPNVQHVISVRGRTPEGCYCYPFGDQDDPDEWLDVRRIGNLRLLLTQGSAGGNVRVITQQLHPY